jgi:hypothetical protein
MPGKLHCILYGKRADMDGDRHAPVYNAHGSLREQLAFRDRKIERFTLVMYQEIAGAPVRA